MTQQWYEYGYGLKFKRGDVGIGGEHGADFDTPLFTPITALLPGFISGIQLGCGFCQAVTWKLKTPHNGVHYMYNIHLAAIAPGIQIGTSIDAGTLIGYSGGATDDTVERDLANTPYRLPHGLSNFLDKRDQSEGAHVEVGFTHFENYGTAPPEVFSTGYLARHPELNPVPFLDDIRIHGIQKEKHVLDIQEASGYFSEKNEKCWRGIRPGHEFDVHDGILNFYRSFGGNALNGLTYLGLPLSAEIPIPNHSRATFQRFERATVCYDPVPHQYDSPPGSGDVYLIRLDNVPNIPG
jgi:hypothetical protein